MRDLARQHPPFMRAVLADTRCASLYPGRRERIATRSVQGPTIGRNVKIGTGAKIVGPVTIGDGARIGANAVVVDDVAARTTVVGVPSKVVPQSKIGT